MIEEKNKKTKKKNGFSILKYLATKGEIGLLFATILVINGTIIKAVMKVLFRLFISVAIIAFLLMNLSFDLPKYLSQYDLKVVAKAAIAKITGRVEEEQEVESTMIYDGIEVDMAKLEDLIAIADEHSLDYEEVLNADTFDKNDWKLMLVNKTNTIPSDYTFTLGTIKGNMKCDERILRPLSDMFSEAAKDGVNLVVCSPYRDLSLQVKLFDRKMDAFLENGYSYMDAYKATSAAVTVPGTSEHQLGLAIDIVCDYYNSLNSGFANTTAGKWLKDNSYRFGFVLRYPKDKENITGIMFEPWHFRYVGVEAATFMYENDLCLEEFHEII